MSIKYIFKRDFLVTHQKFKYELWFTFSLFLYNFGGQETRKNFGVRVHGCQVHHLPKSTFFFLVGDTETTNQLCLPHFMLLLLLSGKPFPKVLL